MSKIRRSNKNKNRILMSAYSTSDDIKILNLLRMHDVRYKSIFELFYFMKCKRIECSQAFATKRYNRDFEQGIFWSSKNYEVICPYCGRHYKIKTCYYNSTSKTSKVEFEKGFYYRLEDQFLIMKNPDFDSLISFLTDQIRQVKLEQFLTLR